MNPLRGVLWIVAGLACGSVWPQARDAVNPPPGTASQPQGGSSPAVQATHNARAPEEMRPEKRPVPQVTVPLKRHGASVGATAPSVPAPSRPTVDDEVARCRASESARERAACNALTPGRKPEVAVPRGG